MDSVQDADLNLVLYFPFRRETWLVNLKKSLFVSSPLILLHVVFFLYDLLLLSHSCYFSRLCCVLMEEIIAMMSRPMLFVRSHNPTLETRPRRQTSIALVCGHSRI